MKFVRRMRGWGSGCDAGARFLGNRPRRQVKIPSRSVRMKFLGFLKLGVFMVLGFHVSGPAFGGDLPGDWRRLEQKFFGFLDDPNVSLSHKIAGLRQARSQIFVLPVSPDAHSGGVSREQKRKLFLRLIRATSDLMDPGFDSKNRFVLNVAPPAETQMPPGVAPAAIRDPVLRRQYEAAIACNRRQADVYNDQTALRGILEIAIDSLRRFRKAEGSKLDAKIYEVEIRQALPEPILWEKILSDSR